MYRASGFEDIFFLEHKAPRYTRVCLYLSWALSLNYRFLFWLSQFIEWLEHLTLLNYDEIYLYSKSLYLVFILALWIWEYERINPNLIPRWSKNMKCILVTNLDQFDEQITKLFSLTQFVVKKGPKSIQNWTKNSRSISKPSFDQFWITLASIQLKITKLFNSILVYFRSDPKFIEKGSCQSVLWSDEYFLLYVFKTDAQLQYYQKIILDKKKYGYRDDKSFQNFLVTLTNANKIYRASGLKFPNKLLILWINQSVWIQNY